MPTKKEASEVPILITIAEHPDFIKWFHQVCRCGGANWYKDGITPTTKLVGITPTNYDITQFPRLSEVQSVVLVYKMRS